MKPARFLALLALLALPVSSHAGDFPFGASVGTTLSFNQANFVDLGGGDDAGWVMGTVNASLFYSPPVKGLNVFTGLNVQRPLRESFGRAFVAGGVPVQPYQTQISDISLGVSYMIAKTGPVVHVVSGGVVVPISQVSRSTGLITRFSPSYTAQAILPAGLALFANVGGSVNALQTPTIEIDCGQFPNLCTVRGGAGGMAAPNIRATVSASGGINWQTPVPGLGVRGSYFWTNGFSAVNFEDDDVTSPFAQTGRQTQGDLHGTGFSLTLAPALIGIKAPPPGVPLAMLKSTREPRAIDAFIFQLGMQTFGALRTNDNKGIRNPLFDTESNTKGRTSYFFRISARL